MSISKFQAEFRQIADVLRGEIERGVYPPGSPFPTEHALAQRFRVDRITVNRAVRILRGEGLVRVERGRGVVVRKIPVIRRSAMARYARAARERGGV